MNLVNKKMDLVKVGIKKFEKVNGDGHQKTSYIRRDDADTENRHEKGSDFP